MGVAGRVPPVQETLEKCGPSTGIVGTVLLRAAEDFKLSPGPSSPTCPFPPPCGLPPSSLAPRVVSQALLRGRMGGGREEMSNLKHGRWCVPVALSAKQSSPSVA